MCPEPRWRSSVDCLEPREMSVSGRRKTKLVEAGSHARLTLFGFSLIASSVVAFLSVVPLINLKRIMNSVLREQNSHTIPGPVHNLRSLRNMATCP